jgi:hypothetical protein
MAGWIHRRQQLPGLTSDLKLTHYPALATSSTRAHGSACAPACPEAGGDLWTNLWTWAFELPSSLRTACRARLRQRRRHGRRDLAPSTTVGERGAASFSAKLPRSPVNHGARVIEVRRREPVPPDHRITGMNRSSVPRSTRNRRDLRCRTRMRRSPFRGTLPDTRAKSFRWHT